MESTQRMASIVMKRTARIGPKTNQSQSQAGGGGVAPRPGGVTMGLQHPHTTGYTHTVKCPK